MRCCHVLEVRHVRLPPSMLAILSTRAADPLSLHMHISLRKIVEDISGGFAMRPDLSNHLLSVPTSSRRTQEPLCVVGD
jgi:hypothetical protein